ncbi:MAG TPA: hypothetical protein VFE25_04125 [Opitutaceae bacterium]|jgi:hypothetical protein|nr:hypothetical protein [Opitutaceae bacterium]
MTRAKPGTLRPETSKKPGLAYAFTNEGVELPVIDVTHPAFEVLLTEEQIASGNAAFLTQERRRAKTPMFIRRFLFRRYARRSVILQGMMQASKSFLSGMNTYILKLGAANLGNSYATNVDRFVAASFPAQIIRLRTQNTAKLLALGIEGPLRDNPGAPFHLLNIAGGPSADSLNALILIAKTAPGLLRARRICIHVLDLEKDAPDFGKRALEALQAQGGALERLDITFTHAPYNWSDTTLLRDLLKEIGSGPCVAAVSTEGGLFEYGNDRDITANLELLMELAPAGTFVVGSVTRDDESNRMLLGPSHIPVVRRGLPVFRALAKGAGWEVETAIETPFSDVVRLARIRSSH